MTELDPLDERLVQELRKNGRATVVELARRLTVPRTTIVGRLKRLEGTGVILGYAARVDHAKLGLPVSAFVMIGFAPDSGRDQRELARRVASFPGVEEVEIVSGEWDILVKVRGKTIESIGDLVLDKIRREKGVGRTLTMASFGRVKEAA